MLRIQRPSVFFLKQSSGRTKWFRQRIVAIAKSAIIQATGACSDFAGEQNEE